MRARGRHPRFALLAALACVLVQGGMAGRLSRAAAEPDASTILPPAVYDVLEAHLDSVAQRLNARQAPFRRNLTVQKKAHGHWYFATLQPIGKGRHRGRIEGTIAEQEGGAEVIRSDLIRGTIRPKRLANLLDAHEAPALRQSSQAGSKPVREPNQAGPKRAEIANLRGRGIEVRLPGATRGQPRFGGHDDVHGQLEEALAPLKRPDLAKLYGASPSRGILFVGPPGTGKSLLAGQVAEDLGVPLVVINGPSVKGSLHGESEGNIRAAFTFARKHGGIIYVDEIDALATNRGRSGEEARSIVGQLATEMDGVDKDPAHRVLFIAGTNRPHEIDPAIRRAGRLEDEIHIGLPDLNGRAQILEIHMGGKFIDPTAKTNLLKQVAKDTDGYTGADLARATEVASRLAMIEQEKKEKAAQAQGQEPPSPAPIASSHFKQALQRAKPTSMREFLLESPNVKWSDVIIDEEAKQTLREAIVPALQARIRERGAEPPKGILLIGPPGNGKTLAGKAAATEAGSRVLLVNAADLVSPYIGQSRLNAAEFFQRLDDASRGGHLVVIVDEIDQLGGERIDHIDHQQAAREAAGPLHEFLERMDGMRPLKNVTFIGLTNRPEALDSALLRPGRFGEHIEIKLPREAARLALLRLYTGALKLDKKSVNERTLRTLAKETAGLSGAEMKDLANRAGIQSSRDQGATHVTKKHFDAALRKAREKLAGRGWAPSTNAPARSRGRR